MARSPPLVITRRRGGRGASVDQRVRRFAGSPSMRMTSVASASSVPRMIADVVFPAPPFEVANEITGIAASWELMPDDMRTWFLHNNSGYEFLP